MIMRIIHCPNYAAVLRKLSVPGRPTDLDITNLDISRARPIALAVGAAGGGIT